METKLIERAVRGDGEAFGELYQNHLDEIYRYIYYRVGDERDAEDLTELVFLKAWQALPAYRIDGSPFSCWLYRIAHNAVIDYHRCHPPVTLSIDDPCGPEAVEGNPLKQVIAYEESRSLAQAISNLTEEQQQVIILRFIEGQSHAEIARILDKREGACRMIQNRALIALHHYLREAQG